MTIDQAREVLRIEAEGILNLVEKVGTQFSDKIDARYRARGRLIVTGIGKSGIVGRKIVATLNSTGTRSIFLHPVEAMHGDLGMVSREDVVLALSYSGETDELNILIPSIRRLGCRIIAFTGNTDSTLAGYCDIVIDVGVPREACPLGLAPTASTTAMLAMGDAMAVVLINRNRFRSSDFKRIHPSGNLGQRLANKVGDLMLTGEFIPAVFQNRTMEDVVAEIDRAGLGAVFILSSESALLGIITDGDIRRLVAGKKDLFQLEITNVMTPSAKSVTPETPAYDALNMMEDYQITVLPVTDENGKVHGILHLHDILGKGEFKFNGR